MARFKQLILVLMALLAASELAVNAEPRRRHKIRNGRLEKGGNMCLFIYVVCFFLSLAVSLFNIIEFPNAVCAGSNGRNGTCYTT